MTARRRLAGLAAPLLLLPLVATAPADAVSADLGNQVVSAFPKLGTPHVMDGSVQAITQVGSKVVVAGTFTRVSPSATFTDTSDDLTRNGMFAFDAATRGGGSVALQEENGKTVIRLVPLSAVAGKTRHMPDDFLEPDENRLSAKGHAYLDRLLPRRFDPGMPFV